MRRDNFDGKDYLKLAEDCVYYAWQNGKISDEEFHKTENAISKRNLEERLQKVINQYEEIKARTSVFSTEYSVYDRVLSVLKNFKGRF